ncbi:MAG TPA: transposase [Sphingobacteriaceae bacterium]
MANLEHFNSTQRERQLRSFSPEFKRKKVQEIECKISTIREISRQYRVSQSAVRKWLRLYSTNYQPGTRTIVESESDTKKLIELQKKIAELERLVGQKQIQLDFTSKMIELAEEYYGIDIKKKFENKPSSGSGDIEKA